MPGRDDFINQASPPCHECGEPVQRVEIPWQRTSEGWRPGPAHMLCAGHRVRVEAFESEETA